MLQQLGNTMARQKDQFVAPITPDAGGGGADALLLESGDYILLESGDKILLE